MPRKPPRGDYEVGYGKPPQHSRFRPGRSGNPRGRPKGSKNSVTLLTEALEEKAIIKEAGERRTINKREVVFKQLVNKAAGGDLQAMRLLISLLPGADDHGPEVADARPEEQPLAEADQLVMENLRKRLLRPEEDGDA